MDPGSIPATAVALGSALAAGTDYAGLGLVSRTSPSILARSAAFLDEQCFALFKLKAGARCLQAILREINGRDLSNSRLLLYTEDDGKAWLLARLSEKIARKRKNGVADTNVSRSFFSVVGEGEGDKQTHKTAPRFEKQSS